MHCSRAARGLLWLACAFTSVASAQAEPGAATASTAPAVVGAAGVGGGAGAAAATKGAAAPFAIPSPEGLTMPTLAFTATAQDELDYDKYFYFHRADTTFAQAYADIKECDALSSGSSIYYDSSSATAAAMANSSVLAAGVGGAIAGAMMDAIFGSSARREQRRQNLRNCMHFKDYQRYGLSHELWSEFNFEEGNGRKKEGVRNDALALQALVASGPAPKTKELGL
ncbi:hypothetical protein [Novosphingobium huizhouense]|uniref:hypothetical protein n=1 Tax=Novosphingobium huizhouense TaxID=2866625 RepID=UPI001CD83037|nr:hypothetical protein [Novosphingobium huizhouense]